MMNTILKGYEVMDCIYTKKGFDASENLKDNFGMSLMEALEVAKSSDEMTEESFKIDARREPGRVGVIAKKPKFEEVEGVGLATMSIYLFKNTGKHHLLPSWLPSGEIQVRLVKETEPEPVKQKKGAKK